MKKISRQLEKDTLPLLSSKSPENKIWHQSVFCLSFQMSHQSFDCCLLATGMLLHSQTSCKFFQNYEFSMLFDTNFSSYGITEYMFFHINFVIPLLSYSSKKCYLFQSYLEGLPIIRLGLYFTSLWKDILKTLARRIW